MEPSSEQNSKATSLKAPCWCCYGIGYVRNDTGGERLPCPYCWSSDVRWVRQEHANGCIPASLAMVLGESYADMCAELEAQQFVDHDGDWDAHGIDHVPMDRLLIDRGYFLRRVFVAWKLDPWPPAPFAPVHLAQVDQGSGNRHCVVMDAEGRVLDPLREGVYSLAEWPKVNNVVGLVRP